MVLVAGHHHNLAYVELQPDLFTYLFPVCLMDWHQTLLQNVGCSHGDSDFHLGVHRGHVFERLTPQQRTSVYEFFRDSFLVRLDQERGLVYRGSKTPAYGWMHRFNSLGSIMPRIDLLWDSWWSLDTPGRAVAAIQYCSGLMYFEGENPIFAMWTPESGGGGPGLWESDTLVPIVWLPENVELLRKTLTATFVTERVRTAVTVLANEPEHSQAKQVGNDLERCGETVRSRIEELPSILTNRRLEGWTI